MKELFLDTNVVIDFLTNREPFSHDIMQIFNFSRKNELKLSVSSLTISNAYYIISRIENKNSAFKKIEILHKLVNILNVGQKEIDLTLKSKFKDFEDGIQNFCASESHLKIIITRNVKDFKESNLSIMTPSEYLVQLLKNK